jgi:molecular chaperone GrpE
MINSPEPPTQDAAFTDRDDGSALTADDRILQLEASLAEMRERWVRSEAENANVRSRAKREVEEARRFAIEKFALDVVEAAENLRRVIDKLPPTSGQEPPSIAGIRAGLIETERSFVALLDRHGIKRVDPSGTDFDPNFHQAMAEQPGEGQRPGTVLKALSPTWLLNGRLLRAAMVIIAKQMADDRAPPR